MSNNKLIILRGYPGSGKTTVGKELEKLGIGKFIDHNFILTFVAGIAGNDDGIYDEIANLEIAITEKLLNEGKSVIVARGFSNLQQIAAYETVARNAGVKSIVARLEVDQKELIKRIQSPERKLDFNPTISQSAATRWMIEHPIEPHADEIVIDNNQPIGEAVAEIASVTR